MKHIKKIALALMIVGVGTQTVFAETKEELTPLEIADPELPGGSYDARIEMAKKVEQLKELSLQPSQIHDVKEILLNQQRANITPYTSIATPVTRSLNIKFTPGLTPPVIRLSANMLSTIVFTDAVGNPWRIVNVALNRTLFSDGSDAEVQQQGSQSGQGQETAQVQRSPNVLSIEPLNPVAYGNVAVTLEGLDTPVILLLTTDQKEVDLRVDARVPGLNPNRPVKESFSSSSSSSVSSSGGVAGSFNAVDDMTLLFVDGTPPKDALPLKASSHEIEAWEFDNELVVRTNSQVIFPAYKAAVTSSSGMTVYRFDQDTKAITLSKGTASKNIYIEQP